MKKSLYNVIFGILGQAIILALGIFLPRFILQSYGDEANGLINAIGQVFTYLALIEAGVGQSALQALYGPIAKNNYSDSNATLSATQQMFRKLTYIYMIFVVAIAFLYPVFVNVENTQTINVFGSTYWAIFFIVIIDGFSRAISFYFIATFKWLLIADGRNYITVNIATIARIVLSVLKIILINLKINIVALQLIYLIVTISEVIAYRIIIKKQYPWMDLSLTPNKGALSQRNAFVVHEISNAVFSSTDMLVLSVFCDLKVVSIYAIYNMVFSAINTLIAQVHNGCFFILGQTYNKEISSYEKVHDAYDTYYISLVFSLISTAYVMILPFIKLYTRGISDLNYVDTILPILFCSIQLLSCCRITSSNLIKIAGHAKKTAIRSIAETVINLVSSLFLVQVIGVYGVLLGTIFALLYRTNDMIIYANKRILKRNPLIVYRTLITNILLFLGVAFLCQFIDFNVQTFGSFFIVAGCVCIILMFVFFAINSIVNKKSFRYVLSKIMPYISKKVKK